MARLKSERARPHIILGMVMVLILILAAVGGVWSTPLQSVFSQTGTGTNGTGTGGTLPTATPTRTATPIPEEQGPPPTAAPPTAAPPTAAPPTAAPPTAVAPTSVVPPTPVPPLVMATPVSAPVPVSTQMAVNQGARVNAANVSVNIPPNAVAGQQQVNVNIVVQPPSAAPPAPAPANFTMGTTSFELNMTTLAGAAIHELAQPLVLEITISPQDLATAGGDASKLELQFFDEVTGLWVPVHTEYNPVTGRVTATITHLTRFALMVRTVPATATPPAPTPLASVPVAQAIAPTASNVVLIYGYVPADTADPWKLYDPAAPPFVRDLQTLDRGGAYWILVNANVTLDSGVRVYTLTEGWNLIGWQGYVAPAVPVGPVASSQAFASIANQLVLVYSYNPADTADPWKMYDPAAPPYVSDMQTVTRGTGYWINVSQSATLTFGTASYQLLAGWNLIGWLG